MDFSRDSLLKELENTNVEYKKVIIEYTDNLLKKDLPVIYSLNHFAGILGLDLSELKTIIHNIDGYYAYYLIKKKHGGKRRIVTPYRNLKMIQTWILHEILNKIPVHSQSKGFVKGSNTLQNAKPHISKQYIRNFDLKDFFESITIDRVYGVFLSLGYSPAVSFDLASLCTLKISDYKFENLSRYKKNYFRYLHVKPQAVLAQGAPTSPALANLICRHLDERFWKFSLSRGIQYTRYADDLTFSSNQLELLPNTSFVNKIVNEEGLQLNYQKIGTYGKSSRQMVTGILINGESPKLPQKFKRQIYRHLHFCKKFGTYSHFNHIMPNYAHARQWLYGKIMYVNSIEPDEAKKMLSIANSLDWGLL